jgi:hypothetical protein
MVFDVQDALDVPAQRHLELRVPPCDDCEVSEFPETGSTGSGTGSDTATCDGDQPPTQAPPGDCWICEDNFWKTIDKDFAEATKKAVSYCNESSEVPASSGGPGGGGGPTEKMRLFDENKRAAQNYIAMCRNLLMDAASMNLGIELLDNDFKKAQNSILRAQLLPPAEFDKKCGANVEGGACAVLPGGDIFVRDNNNQAMTISIQDSLLHEGVHVLLNSAAPLDTAEAAAARDHPFWTGFRQKHPIEQACRG